MKSVILTVLALAVCAGFSESQLTQFPAYFKFGSASASYQIEGGWDADGKGENIWDRFTHKHPEKIFDRSNGDIAADSYYLYREDVQMLKNAGVDFYRFSISWSRVMPTGDTSHINEAGLQYYDNLIDELLANGIEPMVTIYHWDLPQPIQELGGWTNPEIIDYFTDYAAILFERYADRVSTWITFNEPKIFCENGYGEPDRPPFTYAPGVGNYLCAHHLLIAHAYAYQIYHEQFQRPGGKIGIVLDHSFGYPKNASDTADVEATERFLQFNIGQFAHPIFSAEGGYPQVMIDAINRKSTAEGRAWSRLPVMTPEIKELIKGKADFLGFNYYTTSLIEATNITNAPASFWNDQDMARSPDPSWVRAKSAWLYSVPDGLRGVLNWIRVEYNNPEVIITENGWSDDGELQDNGRIAYLKSHIQAILDAINDGCNVVGHTTWSIMDNFEWMMGYSERFGIYHVNFDVPERTRTAKASVAVLRQIIETRVVPA